MIDPLICNRKGLCTPGLEVSFWKSAQTLWGSGWYHHDQPSGFARAWGISGEANMRKVPGKSGQLVILSLKFYPTFLNTCISKNQRIYSVTFVFLLVEICALLVVFLSFSDCRTLSMEMVGAPVIRYWNCGSPPGCFVLTGRREWVRHDFSGL